MAGTRSPFTVDEQVRHEEGPKMNRNSCRYLAMALCTALLTIGLPTVVLAQGDAPVTLRLAVADGQDAQSEPYVQAFIDAAAARSGGSITIEPHWFAAGEVGPV